jgi:hypothetical protein
MFNTLSIWIITHRFTLPHHSVTVTGSIGGISTFARKRTFI